MDVTIAPNFLYYIYITAVYCIPQNAQRSSHGSRDYASTNAIKSMYSIKLPCHFRVQTSCVVDL